MGMKTPYKALLNGKIQAVLPYHNTTNSLSMGHLNVPSVAYNRLKVSFDGTQWTDLCKNLNDVNICDAC